MAFDSLSVRRLQDVAERAESDVQKSLKRTPSDAIASAGVIDQWVRLTAAVDALRSLLEDSYVSWSEDLPRKVDSALNEAATNPHALIQLAWEIARLRPLRPEWWVRTIRTPKVKADYVLRVAPPGQSAFLISTGETRELPILDDTYTDPRYCGGLIDAYADLVRTARKRHKASYIAFIDKNFGPVGGLGMISSVVHATGLPATIYRERKWSKKADLTGYRPEPHEKGILVYDLLNTGSAIRDAAGRIREEFKSEIVAAAILYNLSGKHTVTLSKDSRVVIYSLDVAGTSKPKTRPMPKLDPVNRERLVAAADVAAARRSFPAGEEMSDQPPAWRTRLDDYDQAELVAVSFATVRAIERAIDVFWDEPQLRGMPREFASSDTLVLPKTALPILKARKLRFSYEPIAAGDREAA